MSRYFIGRMILWYEISVDYGAEAERLARTYVWWQEPQLTLRQPRKLLCQILRLGRSEDFVAAQRIWGRDALRHALIHALPGEIDPKSESFWRLWFDLDDARAGTHA